MIVGSHANGATDRVVQTLGKQVVCRGRVSRIGILVKWAHPLVAWLVAHTAHVLSDYEVGVDWLGTRMAAGGKMTIWNGHYYGEGFFLEILAYLGGECGNKGR